MDRIKKISTAPGALPGSRILSFATILVNVGAGPLELNGTRASTSDPMTVTQRIYDDSGGYQDMSTTASMFYAGDGHEHWHVRDLVSYELQSLQDGSDTGHGAKSGFCFFDNVQHDLSLPNAPQSAVYKPREVCSEFQPDALDVVMGLSVGWGDKYGPRLPGQYIDITGVPNGRYRLFNTVDQGGWFTESDETNNTTWEDIKITTRSVSVLKHGPHL